MKLLALLILALALGGCVVTPGEPLEYTPYPSQTYVYPYYYPYPAPVYGGWGWHRQWRR